MNSQDEVLSFLDLLDLDEELIDSRLNSIMVKSNHTNKHLKDVIQLLQYKCLINIQEGIECENNEEYNFVVRLVNDMQVDNIDNVCKIIELVLGLHASTLVPKAEHLIQQILSNINLPSETKAYDNEESLKTLLYLKVCNSILEATLKNGERISLIFLEIPLENLLCTTDEKLKMYFLTNTVRKLFEGVIGYNILDRIWNYLIQIKGNHRDNVLKVLSCLSDYYLPVADSKENIQFESKIGFQYEFWDIILFGLMSDDPSIRKISLYLAKRALDCIATLKVNINVQSENLNIFSWQHARSKMLKKIWDDFFILMDSLEEKQSNIVLPSLQLFETLNEIGYCWLNCAFNIGLKHDNTQVRLKCLEYRLKEKVNDTSEAMVLLEAFNDVNIFDKDYETMKARIGVAFNDKQSFIHIFKAISSINWSPVPLYHLSDILAKLNVEIYSTDEENEDVPQIINDILKVSCNNIFLRKAIQLNISYLVGMCCKELNWKSYANIYPAFQFEISTRETNDRNPFISLIKNTLLLKDDEKISFYTFITNNYTNIDFGLLYLDNHPQDIHIFTNLINKKIKNVHDVLIRQYSNKMECYKDVNYLIYLLKKSKEKENLVRETIILSTAGEYKAIFLYTLCLLSSELVLTVEEIVTFFKAFDFISMNNNDTKELLIQIYKTSVLLLKDKNTELDKTVFSMFVVKNLTSNSTLVTNYKHEMINLINVIELGTNFIYPDDQNAPNVGRLRNIFYEKNCETVFMLLEEEDEKEIDKHVKEIIDYVENVIECGGYGCLKWILRIMNKIMNKLTNFKNMKLNITQFINRMWKEIEELKSNNQYSPCIKEFIYLITQETLLEKAAYNNIIILYCNKIIENGSIRNTPLYYLVKNLNGVSLKKYSHLVYIFGEILLYCPIPRKDQRITDNLILDILKSPKHGLMTQEMNTHFNFKIQYLAVAILCKVEDADTLGIISLLITNKIENTFKNKQRYHGNSQLHRILLSALQHLLLILLKSKIKDSAMLLTWGLELLGKLPHQSSVRICLEWYISLHFYLERLILSEGILETLKTKNVPLTSQFIIIYWLLKHKMLNSTYSNEEYNFVMDTLLSYTMGQVFNIRLHAQFLATKLHEINKKPSKYDYTIQIIKNTFEENSKDKNFIKLKEDYFINDFDIVGNLTPIFIYHFLPRFCEITNNESIDVKYIENTLKDIDEIVSRHNHGDNFKEEWLLFRKTHEDFDSIDLHKYNNSKSVEDVESVGTIQKKYIPWKNMSDINMYDVGKKKESRSDLIVVASLIDKLPNLGGMARTSEVFGVKTYVVDSLRHLHDKQFQGLSVSAERWINIEEVRPGLPLKEYLIRKKTEGYSVVAAEQTSVSSNLQNFRFPKKSLLLLGHEKEGIPCDLLPMMDHCIEIPQQGFVRSLNVHVTAAIFVWEYVRQNIL